MRIGFSILAMAALFACFTLLVFDFWRFFASQGQGQSLRLAALIGQSAYDQVRLWAALEGSTWGNFNRLALLPFITHTPLWALTLLISTLLWALRPAKNS